MLIKMDGRRLSRKNSTKLCPNINGKREVTSKLEKQIKTPAGCYLVVIWQLSFSHLQSLNLEANLWLAKTAWVGERILDVIRRLTPSSFVDWSLIGNESTAFPLWGRQGRWQLEHMDWKWVSVWCFCSTQTHKLHFKQLQTTRQKAVTFLYSLSFN